MNSSTTSHELTRSYSNDTRHTSPDPNQSYVSVLLPSSLVTDAALDSNEGQEAIRDYIIQTGLIRESDRAAATFVVRYGDRVLIPVSADSVEHDLQDDCPICLLPNACAKVVMLAGCRHVFHRYCISAWVQGKLEAARLRGSYKYADCPLCRADIWLRLVAPVERRGSL